MSEANSLNIRVHEFFTQPDPVKDERGKETGEVVMRDYVKYGPPHLMDRQATIAIVSRLLSAKRPAGDNNIAALNAWKRAEYIRPLYEAWKKGEEVPDGGMPIAALNFLRKEDLDLLKSNAIRSVEELANLPDSVLDRIRVPGMREKRIQAKRFLEAQDSNKAAAQMAARDAEIAELKAQMAELLGSRDEVDENGDRVPKRRGRPAKVSHETVEAA